MNFEHDWELIDSENLIDSFLVVNKDTIRYRCYNGQLSDPHDRMVISKANSVGILLFHTVREKFILVEQFRYPARADNNGYISEIVAGNIDSGETAENAIRREVMEETGYMIHEALPIANGYSSPGICTEKLDLFYAEVDDSMLVNTGGGLSEEEEDIKIVEWSVDKTLTKLRNQSILDLKTLVAIQWFYLNKIG